MFHTCCGSNLTVVKQTPWTTHGSRTWRRTSERVQNEHLLICCACTSPVIWKSSRYDKECEPFAGTFAMVKPFCSQMISGHAWNPGNASHDLLDSREVPIKSWEREWQPLAAIGDTDGISFGLESCICSFIWRLLIFYALNLAVLLVMGRPRTEGLQCSHPSCTSHFCSLLQTCVTFSAEASTDCREQCMLLLFHKTRWLMIYCEQTWQLLNLLGGITANFPALSASQCSIHCLAISACSSEVLGNHRSHLIPWKLSAELRGSSVCLSQQRCWVPLSGQNKQMVI